MRGISYNPSSPINNSLHTISEGSPFYREVEEGGQAEAQSVVSLGALCLLQLQSKVICWFKLKHFPS